ncbi:protein of unknown function [Clostridium beijerinckii]|nr:protein of unknown function [Clostridium beijerinckii]
MSNFDFIIDKLYNCKCMLSMFYVSKNCGYVECLYTFINKN